MKEKIKNTVLLQVEGVNLQTSTDLEVWIRQGCKTSIYTPTVTDPNAAYIAISKEEAMKLRIGSVRLQMAGTDENGEPWATDIAVESVDELLKEEGYGDD